MDLMEIRRGLLAMANGLPSYLKHAVFKPSVNTSIMEINVGEGYHAFVFISDCPTTGLSVTTAQNGMISLYSNGTINANGSRLIVRNTGGSLDYWSSNSSGQSWSYVDGVLRISSSNKYDFGAGIHYDFFYC